MDAAPAALYHAAPLHYLPHILRSGMLCAASVLAAQGVAPRPGAKRRDRMLGLADWAHLSTAAGTPLLADKIRRGYPHALLIFDGPATLALPGVALIPHNAKAWRTRAEYAPATDPARRSHLLREHLRGRHPSLEILVQYALGLETLTRVAFIDWKERDSTAALLNEAGADIHHSPLTIEPELFPGALSYQPQTLGAIAEYFSLCRASGRLLPPPAIPFD